jgi:hypothetical protein
VNLVVVRVNAWAESSQGVPDPSILTGSEHASHNNELMVLRDLSQLLRPRSIDWFGDLSERQAEATHGGFRKDHQLCAALGSVGGSGCDELEIFLRI